MADPKVDGYYHNSPLRWRWDESVICSITFKRFKVCLKLCWKIELLKLKKKKIKKKKIKKIYKNLNF
jgi:hypothetical protein